MKDSVIVNGGKALYGTFEIQGSKNEAFPVMCAALLTTEKVVIKNIPSIVDVGSLLDIFRILNVEVEQLNEHDYAFCAKNLVSVDEISFEELRDCINRLRGGVLVLAPMLVRFGKMIIPMPGGDKIGRRHLDTHFKGLAEIGVHYVFDKKLNAYVCTTKKLEGNYVLLDEASVTGTANMILASVFAKGKTIIYNAACEPHIQQLCLMLTRMGAKINGIGSNQLEIEGVETLHGTEHTLSADLIEIGSIIGLAAMTKSNINIKFDNIDSRWLYPVTSRFQRLGIAMEIKNEGIFVQGEKDYEIQPDINRKSIVHIDDAIWPGFPSDLLTIILVTATQAKGSVLFHEKLYESRLFFIDNLIEMGAKIILCDPHRAHVIGINREYNLKGIEISTPDIRTGISMLIAALSAEGQSRISKFSIIQRGYQDIITRLQKLGADINEDL